MSLTDRVALVTGASRGIGAVTAQVLARRGARVAVSARSVGDLEKVVAGIIAAGGKALAVPCDAVEVTQVDAMVQRVVREWGRLDILVNNAGMGTPTTPVETISPADWDATVDLNLKSAFLAIRAAAPVMKAQKAGRIINVASFAGRRYSLISGPMYTAAKAGMLGLARHMAGELGPFGISVNSVAPSIALTARVKAKWEAKTSAEQQAILSNIPLRRLAEPEEVATVIAFLASDDASYVNGVCIDINGGSYMM